MTNTKLYYLTQADFDSQIKNGKFPLQQKQIYKALAANGKPMRGMDAVEKAVKEEGLITRQAYDVLAAWYFSPKRRPLAYVTLGEPTIVNEDLADKITRLTAEIEAKGIELLEAEEALRAELEAEAKEEETESEANEQAKQEISEAEAEQTDAA